jgi:hypothetical protein
MGSVDDWKALQAQFDELLAGPGIPCLTRLAAINTQEQLHQFQPSICEWMELIRDLKANACASDVSAATYNNDREPDCTCTTTAV